MLPHSWLLDLRMAAVVDASLHQSFAPSIMSTTQQPQPRVLRKAPSAPGVALPEGSSQEADGGTTEAIESVPDVEPYTLLDASSWQLYPQAVGDLLTSNQDFQVVGVVGGQGLGKSSFLNHLLGMDGALSASGPHPTPAFPVAASAALAPASVAAAAALLMGQRHVTRGISLRASSDRILALDTQPLFSASVLEDMIAEWHQPPAALAVPAVAAASEARAAAVPFEGVAVLAALQVTVLLLSVCHRVLVFCDGMEDRCTWELLLTAEMLCRGIPDPSLAPREPPPGAAPTSAAVAGGVTGVTAAAAQQAQRQALPQQEHLAEVIFVHVLPPGQGQGHGGGPSAAELQHLERQLDAFFAASRLRRAGPLRMLEHDGSAPRPAASSFEAAHGSSSGGTTPGTAPSAATNSSSAESISYWVLPQLVGGGSAAEEAWADLVAKLLLRPTPAFARRCSERAWLAGVAGGVWRAVRKSPDIATFYSRLARTQLKGAGGWGLAR